MLSKPATLLLGIIYEKPLNAYEITKLLDYMNIKWWFNVADSTVYTTLKNLEKRGLIELITMQKDKRNKLIQFTTEGKEYADSIISELRKVELFVIEKIGIERMKQLNDTNALFVELFKRAGGKNV